MPYDEFGDVEERKFSRFGGDGEEEDTGVGRDETLEEESEEPEEIGGTVETGEIEEITVEEHPIPMAPPAPAVKRPRRPKAKARKARPKKKKGARPKARAKKKARKKARRSSRR